VAQQSLQYLLYESIQDDSLSVLLKQMINNDYMFTIPSFEFESAAVSGDSLFLQYKLNKALLNHFIRPYIDLYGHPGQKPIAPLFTSNHRPPAEDSISELKLLLPCENVPVPNVLSFYQMLPGTTEMVYIGALIFMSTGDLRSGRWQTVL
jgi:hypothetical protein